MPEPLSEMNNMSIITPRVQENDVPRFSNPPYEQQSYQNWTMIEDVFNCQTALPNQTQLSYMPSYNSNGIIPAYHQATCPAPAQQALMNMQRKPLYPSRPQQDIFVPQQQQPFASEVALYNQAVPQYGQAYQYPPFAGSVPNLKDARTNDTAIPLTEGYAPPSASSPSQNTCLECMKHMDGCNLCKKLSGNVEKKYWIGIGILILIIIGLLIYIMKLRGSYTSNTRVGKAMLKGARVY